MALADIQKKNAEERRREKRLVHLTNGLARDYLNSGSVKNRSKADKATAEYVVKSLLDYLFFEDKKELRELNGTHIKQFMLVHATRRLQIAQEKAGEIPNIMNDFLRFLDATGYIKNGELLRSSVKENERAFLKLMPPPKKSQKSRKTAPLKEPAGTKATPAPKEDVRVGRNDPCPCGSGKKFKKCCGQQ